MDEFAAALKNLKTFNRMVSTHPELSSLLIDGDHDFLQWRQAKIFVAFREQYRRATARGAKKSRDRARYLLSGLLACALTAWAALARGKKDVVIFGVDKISAERDHDFRLDGIYRFLKEKNLSFTEILHTQLDGTMGRNARSRKRAAVYREAFEFLGLIWFRFCRCRAEARRVASALSCAEFEEGDRAFARALAEKLLRGRLASRFEIAWYRRVLRRIKPRMILAIDDTRYLQEICAAARAERIPVYAFQHGHFTKYHAGWLASGAGGGTDARPDALFVWSPYWKNELLRLGTNFRADELRVGGNPKGDAPIIEVSTYQPPAAGDRIELLVPFESDAPFDEMKAVMRSLLSTGRVKIWLKTRPDWGAQEQMRRYGLDELSREQAEAIPDHRPLIGRIHAVAGAYSTFLYDALSALRPVFIFKTSMDFGEGMLINGLADAFDAHASDPAGRLSSSCAEAAPKLKNRLETYQGGAGNLTETLRALFGKQA